MYDIFTRFSFPVSRQPSRFPRLAKTRVTTMRFQSFGVDGGHNFRLDYRLLFQVGHCTLRLVPFCTHLDYFTILKIENTDGSSFSRARCIVHNFFFHSLNPLCSRILTPNTKHVYHFLRFMRCYLLVSQDLNMKGNVNVQVHVIIFFCTAVGTHKVISLA